MDPRERRVGANQVIRLGDIYEKFQEKQKGKHIFEGSKKKNVLGHSSVFYKASLSQFNKIA